MKRKVFIELNTDLITVCLLVCFVCRCGENERKVSWAVTFHADGKNEGAENLKLRMPLPFSDTDTIFMRCD